MTETTTTPTIATAYMLADGDAVFLSPDGNWQGDINKAFIARNDDDLSWLKSELMKADQQAVIADGYEIAVSIEPSPTDGNITPLKMRERFRLLKQPTIDYLPTKLHMVA